MIDYNSLIQNVDKQVFYATTLNAGPYSIGQSALGGVIAYILKPGDSGYNPSLQQGIVAASSDQSTGIQWYNGSYILITTNTGYGTGLANTNAIISAQGAGTYAAKICTSYAGGGYSDWYLPSQDELSIVYSNKTLIGGFTSDLYWSSTQYNNISAIAVSFSDGLGPNTNSSTTTVRVRAIRSFSVPALTTPWQTWTKPSGARTAYIVCIGGGGAGGGSATGSASILCGGGGGAGSTITVGQVPFYSISDTLYVQVGIGGVGSIGNGGNGGISYVSCYPTTDMYNCLIANNVVQTPGGTGGVAGVIGFGAGASAALSSSSTTNPRYLSLCNWASYAGGSGVNGGAANAVLASSSTIAASSLTTGGAGGGGCNATVNNAGGSVNSGDTLTPFLKTISGAPISGINGNNGYSYLKPLLGVAGSGGSANLSGAGGTGGKAGIGSGGGGAGSGLTGGIGGNGGDGLVMIISY